MVSKLFLEIRKCEAENKFKHIKTNPLPVIALTADIMSGMSQRCLDLGMNDYLSKPFELSQLDAKIARWIKSETVKKALKQQNMKQEKKAPSEKIDHKALDNIRALQKEGAPDIVARVYHLYRDDAKKLLVSLRDAIQKGQLQSAQVIAHTLKSSSANVGASVLASICKDIEHTCKNNSNENIHMLMDQVEEEYQEACKALDAILVDVV